MEDMTYIKIYRKSLQNEIFLELPFDRWHAFMFLLLSARRFPTIVMIKGKSISLDTGQLIYGDDTLAERWGWSRGKVRRFLSLLEDLEMIKKNGTPYGTVITIENYSKYQCSDTLCGTPVPAEIPTDAGEGGTANGTAHGTADGTAHGTADGTAHGTQKKNDKNDKECKRMIKNVFTPPTVDEVQAYCIERANGIDPYEFVNFYQAKGWMIGKNKMKDWRAAVRTWERSQKRTNSRTANELSGFYQMAAEWAQEDGNDKI